MELCSRRIKAVSEVFSELGIDGVRKFELGDPQYKEALGIARACGRYTPALLGFNAVVAYMLTSKGEDFWHSFSEFTISNCGKLGVNDLVIEFTMRSNPFSLENKLKRLNRLSNCPDLLKDVEKRDLRKYWSDLARCLRASKDSKTIVFSVKMVYYGLRALGVNIELPDEAPIPVDRRISLITLTSGLISMDGCRSLNPRTLHSLRNESNYLMRKPKAVRDSWMEVSRLSKIPALHLDAPLWVIGKYSFLGGKEVILNSLKGGGIGKVFNHELLRKLVDELFYRLP